MKLPALFRFAVIAVLLSLAAIGMQFALQNLQDDPYDPMLGSRNPRAGAERYLSGRDDIPAPQKQALLALRPLAPEMLQVLAVAPAREIRSLVALNPAVSEPVLEQLSRDPEAGVRQYVAANPQTPPALLLRLNSDADENVRWSVQHNPAWRNATHPVSAVGKADYP